MKKSAESELGDVEDRAERLRRLRHSAAHVMAQVVKEHFGRDARLGVGPATDDGFFYDFDLATPLSDQDLEWIEGRMREIIAEGQEFVRRVVSPDEARQLFKDEPLKLELIEGILSGTVDDNGDPLPEAEPPLLTIYQNGAFQDLCRGPHVFRTSEIDPGALKLMGVAGAYWRGNDKRPMLQRVRGTLWESPDELETYLWRRHEAELRDHRRLGRELQLFHLDSTAPGMPYWLPKGLKLLNLLLDFWRREHEERGYQEISSPLINDKSLWETSGHWDHFKDNMFLIPVGENTTYALKPMNCPNAMVVYNLQVRSYRDLPVRLSDCDILHRNEPSGTLHGLLRVRHVQQDDAHIFVSPDQVRDEYDRIFQICDLFYNVFDLTYKLRLGTRPVDFIGDPESWDEAEAALRSILDERLGSEAYEVEEGGGAFYGPKIDIVMEDALGREWQMGTIQLDFQLPRRFGCTYADRDGGRKTPVVIHRVIYGSLERFIGILIEHTGGAFPIWISPVQVKVIPVRAEHSQYGAKVAARLRAEGLRVEVDFQEDTLSAKVRRAQTEKIPVMLVLGERELREEKVTARLRTGINVPSLPIDSLLQVLRASVESKWFSMDHLAASLTDEA